MAMTTRKGPNQGAQIVAQALRDLSEWGGAFPAPRHETGWTTSRASRPENSMESLQRFVVGLDDASNGDVVEGARAIGWRYLIYPSGSQADPVAVVDVTESADGKLSFNSFTKGALPLQIRAAAKLALDLYGSDSDSYDLRIIEIPALHVEAVWLHGSSDRFIVFLDGTHGTQSPVEEVTSFIPDIASYAQQRTSLPPPDEDFGMKGPDGPGMKQ